MGVDGAESKALFAQVQFHIVETDDLHGNSARDVRISRYKSGHKY